MKAKAQGLPDDEAGHVPPGKAVSCHRNPKPKSRKNSRYIPLFPDISTYFHIRGQKKMWMETEAAPLLRHREVNQNLVDVSTDADEAGHFFQRNAKFLKLQGNAVLEGKRNIKNPFPTRDVLVLPPVRLIAIDFHPVPAKRFAWRGDSK